MERSFKKNLDMTTLTSDWAEINFDGTIQTEIIKYSYYQTYIVKGCQT